MLVMPEKARKTMESFIVKGYPYETCGLMLGRFGEDGTEVEWVAQAENLNKERAEDRFQLNPDDWLKIEQRARGEGLEVVGIWHSHPDHPAKPSSTDLEHAWDCYSYVIVSVTKEGVADFRSWRLKGDERVFEEEEVHHG